MPHGVGEDEVAVGQALHQGGGPEAVGAVVGEVRLPAHQEPRDRAHEVVVHPEPAHRVVRGREDAHRDLVGVLVGDPLVHLEEVPVLLADLRRPEPLDRVGEVEVDAQAARAHAAALVADLLGRAGGDVAGGEVAVGRVLPLEVVVALVLGDLVRRPVVARLLRDPDAPVVAQRLAHQGELALVLAVDGDAGGVDLGVAGVGEGRALLVGPPDRRGVAALGVGGEVEDVAVAAGGEDHRVGEVGLELAGDHVAGHDAAGPAVDQDRLEHLVAREHLHLPGADLPHQGLVGAEQQLLAGLASGVERAGDEGAAERAVGEGAPVLAGEGHALGHALVDDVHRQLGEAVDVRLAGPEVAALHGVVEEAPDAVAVVLVVLGRVDPALGRDRVGPARAVLVAEDLDVVAELGHRGGGGAAREAAADHDHAVLPLVGGVDELHVEAVLRPLLGDRARGDVGLEFHGDPPTGGRGR